MTETAPVYSVVAVLGAGTMGHGIAYAAALAGCEVRLRDVDPDRLDHAMSAIAGILDKGIARGKVDAALREPVLSRVRPTTDVAEAANGAELVIESVPEDLDLKRRVLAEVAEHAPDAEFATNTSSLSIARIATALPHPELLVGMHFFNPVHVMKLLELVHHGGTDPGFLDRARRFGAQLGKEVIVVRDSPGFATSRLGIILGMEAIRMLEEGVATAEDIDRAMVLGYRHPIGPLRLTDLVGLDVRMAIGEYLARELGNPAFAPPPLLRRMVKEGRLGRKTGQGFYRWED